MAVKLSTKNSGLRDDRRIRIDRIGVVLMQQRAANGKKLKQ
jgi:hypothetical protein